MRGRATAKVCWGTEGARWIDRMHLIYQYWNGSPMPPGTCAGMAAMRAYAGRIGAEYRCDENAHWSQHEPRYYDCLRPIFDDEFLKFDLVLFADLDVFPVKRLATSIFDEPTAD